MYIYSVYTFFTVQGHWSSRRNKQIGTALIAACQCAIVLVNPALTWV